MTQPHHDNNPDASVKLFVTQPHSDDEQLLDGVVFEDGMLPPGGLPLLGGKYVAQERFEGGMGIVYKCVKRRTGQVVALKTVLSDGPMTEDEIKLMRRNYDRMHALSHDHIVRVNALEVDDATEQWYVEMDWVDGESLERHWRKFAGDIRQKTLDLLRILRQIAEALDYAHGRGVVHRDVKDGNIMIDKAGNAVLIDFGIASRAPHAAGTIGTISHEVTATATVSVFAGTRGYQAPEQWRGERADAASDEYSLAVTAYRCLSGHLPFWSANEGLLQEMVLHADVPSIKSLSSVANAVFQKALAKRASDRYGSCIAFIDALEKGLSSLTGSTVNGGLKNAVVEKNVSFSMQEFYLLAADMEDRLAESGKRKWDCGQTFADHLDAFNKAMRGAKAAAANKDYSVAYNLFKKAETEWKWLEMNGPLRESAAIAHEKAVVARNNAEKAEAARLVEAEFQQAVNLLTTAEGDFASGHFEDSEKRFLGAEKAFADVLECAIKAKHVEDLEKSISEAIDAKCFNDARRDVGELKKLDVEKATSLEADIGRAEIAWKGECIEHWGDVISKSIESKLFLEARQAVVELRKLDASQAASWEPAINTAEEYWKSESIDNLKKVISTAIDEKRFPDARQAVRELMKLDASGVWWERTVDAAVKGERIKALEKIIQTDIDEKRFQNARQVIGELKRLDAAKAASWDKTLAAIVEKTSKNDNVRLIIVIIFLAVSLVLLLQSAKNSFSPVKTENRFNTIPVANQPQKQKNELTIRKDGDNYILTLKPGVELKLVMVEAGSFMMGSDNGNNDEKPVRMVTLTKDFWLGETEVTQAQYVAVMGGNQSEFKDYPMDQVSWYDAIAFCLKITEQGRNAGWLPEGYEFTLPTESQWEYAASGGIKSKGYYTYSGSDNLYEVGWYVDNSNNSKHLVGQKKPNELGLYDMSGNVWEWCSDWYGGYQSDEVTNPIGPSDGSRCVFRGGSCAHPAVCCRSRYRNSDDPSKRYSDLGFRIALVSVQLNESVRQEAKPPVVEEAKPPVVEEAKSPVHEESKPPVHEESKPPVREDLRPTVNEMSGNYVVTLKPGVDIKLVKVEAGSFMMGSKDGEIDETPVHKVTLTKDFWLGETEVTQSQYETVMGENPSYRKGGNYPVENVSWENAQKFCDELNRNLKSILPSGYQFALPTEAQWEYAARGGNKSKGYKYSGSDNLGEVGWYDGNSNRLTHLVGQKKPNELGLYDMSGNVWEWCCDLYWYGGYPNGEVTDPSGPLNGSQRVLRGGGWYSQALGCRSSYRFNRFPSFHDYYLGFRVALAPIQLNETVRQEAKPPVREESKPAVLEESKPSVREESKPSVREESKPSVREEQKTFVYNKDGNIVVTLKPDVEIKLVKVNAGSFMMGSNDGKSDERPMRMVTLTKAFWLGETEVTQAQYEAVLGMNPSIFKRGGNYPVEHVSWYDAIAFCRKITEQGRKAGWLPIGCEFTLPTEAQWEYAACGGIKSKGFKYSGSNNMAEVGWYVDNANKSTHLVGQKSPNELGLYDMSGNVWEWCYDWYGSYQSNTVTNPTGPSVGSQCVLRGGSNFSQAVLCRSASRNGSEPTKCFNDLGFRVVLVMNQLNGAVHKDAKPSVREEQRPTVDKNAGSYVVRLKPGVDIKMVKVKAGSFMMGGEEGDNDEKPVHKVMLTKDFWLGETEVTQAQYEAVMGDNPSIFNKGGRYPVERVSWHDAMGFCRKLTEQERKAGRISDKEEYTLPTEAQWEYAARGGSKSKRYKYSGSDNLDEVGWYVGNSDSSTHPVGQKKANELGLFDMSGNVWEWCLDGKRSYRICNMEMNPMGASSGAHRVDRGGSWRYNVRDCRISYRYYDSPYYCYSDLGFRIALVSKE